MPIVLTNRHERLELDLPMQPTDIQELWPAVKAEVLGIAKVLPPLCQQLDVLIGSAQADEHTTIYFHRVTYVEQQELTHLATERGELNYAALWMETCKRAVDGWTLLYDADLRSVTVPTAATEQEQRAKIAAIVEGFPATARQLIAVEALKDTPNFLLARLKEQSRANSASPLGVLGASLPATSAEQAAPLMG